MAFLDLLLLACATFYTAYTVTSLDGPFHVFLTLRQRFPPKPNSHNVLDCVYCCAPYAAAVLLLCQLSPFPLLHGLVTVLALAGGAIMLGSFSGAMR